MNLGFVLLENRRLFPYCLARLASGFRLPASTAGVMKC